MKKYINEFDIATQIEEPQIDGAEIIVKDADENEVNELLNETDVYVIMYTCYKPMSISHMGTFTGKIDIVAINREDAERIFYELNPPYILDVENDEPIYNYEGGYICECVLTYQEWLDEGAPESLG